MSRVKVETSSGRVFSNKKISKRVIKKQSNIETNFVQNCPAYGLNPDFYMAECLDESDNPYYLQCLENDYGILISESGVSVYKSFTEVLDMLMKSVEMEAQEFDKKIELLYLDSSLESDKAVIKHMRKDINGRKHRIMSARQVYNADMNGIFKYMGVKPYAGCVYYNSVYEFVSFRPDNPDAPYVIENLEKDQYDDSRYKFIDFSTLAAGLKAYTKELPAQEVDGWLRMIEGMIPIYSDNPDCDADAQQLFMF